MSWAATLVSTVFLTRNNAPFWAQISEGYLKLLPTVKDTEKPTFFSGLGSRPVPGVCVGGGEGMHFQSPSHIGVYQPENGGGH